MSSNETSGPFRQIYIDEYRVTGTHVVKDHIQHDLALTTRRRGCKQFAGSRHASQVSQTESLSRPHQCSQRCTHHQHRRVPN